MHFSKEFREFAINFRRDIHKHPELAYREERTVKRISEELTELGIEHQTGIGGTGVVAIIGGSTLPCIAFRGDMDALPITETATDTNKDYISENEGVMHACGHDAHIALLMGMAKYLTENPGILDHAGVQVKLIFQPAEEGGAGALAMIRDGCLANPRVEAIIGQHCIPEVESGQVDYCQGVSHSAADSLHITINGTGGHGARPEETNDPIVAGSYLITQLQSIISRSIPGLESAIVTIGSFHSGSKGNVIPGEAELLGTIRTFSPKIQETIIERIRAICSGLEASFGVDIAVEINRGYPANINNGILCDFFQTHIVNLLGEENVILQPNPSSGSEDFAFFAQRVPSLIHRLGTRNKEKGMGWDKEEGRIIGLHNSRFDIDEEALFTGISCNLEWVKNGKTLIDLLNV